MRLYAGSSAEFIDLCTKGQITELLKREFLNDLGHAARYSEVMSWKSSLPCLAKVLDHAGLEDVGIMLEYRLPPSGRRVDVLICGVDRHQKRNAVLIELKQWSECALTNYDGKCVVTRVGGENQSVLHPSIQVGYYMDHLQHNSSVFYEGTQPIQLSACAYLHNYYFLQDDVLKEDRFSTEILKFPLFDAGQETALASFISERVGGGDGLKVLTEIEQSEVRASPKLLDQVSKVIKKKLKKELKIYGRYKAKGDCVLLDEQLIAYDHIMSLALKQSKEKYAFIIRGGAGTGKSIIALQLLADLATANLKVQHSTGSNAFTETLKKIADVKAFFNYFSSHGHTAEKSIDVLLMDEAHRIREKTASPYKVTNNLQIKDLLNTTYIAVFFIDDHQVVRAGEIGSSEFIRAQATSEGFEVHEYELKANFRNGGSERYSDWIDHMLHIRETPHTEWIDERHFKFKIMDSPDHLEQVLKGKAKQGAIVRITSGFCWDWTTSRLDEHGNLIKDIQIGNYQRPWNAFKNLEGKLAPGIPISTFWAYESGGIDQIGCIYTAQGFEFDYAGVIFGEDLIYNQNTQKWEGKPDKNLDRSVKGKDFVKLVKNTYRVLLGRGMKACYVYFMDKETEAYFRSRVRRS